MITTIAEHFCSDCSDHILKAFIVFQALSSYHFNFDTNLAVCARLFAEAELSVY